MTEIKLGKEKLLNVFVDQLIKDKGWEDRDPEEVLRLQFELETQAEEEIDQTLLDSLTDQQLIELDELTQNGASDEQLEQFFGKLKIDYSDVVQRALANFRQKVLNDEVEE